MHKKSRFVHNSKSILRDKINLFFSRKKLLIIAFLLFIFCVVFAFLLFSVNGDYIALNQEHNSFVAKTGETIYLLNRQLTSFSQKNSDLNNELNELNKNYSSLLSSKIDLDKSYLVLKEEVSLTIKKINDYELEIQKSLEWFSKNSFFDKEQERVLLNLKSNCLKSNLSSCEINLGCFYLVNSEFVNYKYKSDIATAGVLDKLQSLNDFIKNRGGDCEDYSLFFKAEYNSLVNTCGEKQIKLFSWVDKKNSKFWANYQNTWYLDGAEKIYLDKNNIFPIIVCGSMKDLQSGQINGHCVIAFSSIEINSPQDIYFIGLAELIEPQTGEYLGKIGVDSGIFLITDSLARESYINTLITNNDFFLYRDNKWVNYASFLKELDEKKAILRELLK